MFWFTVFDFAIAVLPGWPYLVDYGRNCTSLVEATLSEIIVSMTADGTVHLFFTTILPCNGLVNTCNLAIYVLSSTYLHTVLVFLLLTHMVNCYPPY